MIAFAAVKIVLETRPLPLLTEIACNVLTLSAPWLVIQGCLCLPSAPSAVIRFLDRKRLITLKAKFFFLEKNGNASDHVVAFGARIEKESRGLHEMIIRYVNAWSVGHLPWGVIYAVLTESLEADEPCFIFK